MKQLRAESRQARRHGAKRYHGTESAVEILNHAVNGSALQESQPPMPRKAPPQLRDLVQIQPHTRQQFWIGPRSDDPPVEGSDGGAHHQVRMITSREFLPCAGLKSAKHGSRREDERGFLHRLIHQFGGGMVQEPVHPTAVVNTQLGRVAARLIGLFKDRAHRLRLVGAADQHDRVPRVQENTRE